jgi:putative membrane-bound dehydrogenase-like protein
MLLQSRLRSGAVLSILAIFHCGAFRAVGSDGGTNDLPMPLSEAASHVILPPDFRATLFAGEPDVRQPIAMTFDDRGRLWVAECYTYSDVKTNYDLNLRDRILIFEDSKGTGHFDKRTVFWDQGKRLTSIAVGFGGVFATCAPNLIFIPDRDGDDVPDGPPEILLDGWNADVVRHNIVNGLKWGPDGWLYGRHGILETSTVGKPGAPESQRIKLNCGIWRYHPTRRVFEVVCQGTTNPWGHDWDEYGNLFFINTVIGHLWQGIPGAYFQRMFGEHLAPHRYGLMGQAADHYHWDTGKSWTDSRNAGAGADALGGGHAHSGLMIYLGDNWPENCRGHLFTLNFHGRRINEERLEPDGSGRMGRHEPDFVKFQDRWFRGIDLDYGPDGGVYVLDWSDTGECHGNNGVNRESGRIYKLIYEGQRTQPADPMAGLLPTSLLKNGLANLSSSELLHLQFHRNEWYARHARRLLQERAESGVDLSGVQSEALKAYESQTDISLELRILFTLHGIRADSTAWLKAQLGHGDEHVRAWAVRFLAESGTDWRGLIPAFTQHAIEDPAPAVRLELASALQRMPVGLREPVAMALLKHREDINDNNLPLMLWYGIEPIASLNPAAALRLATQSVIPLVRECISRRLGEELANHPETVEALLQAAAKGDSDKRLDFLRGLAQALHGWRHAPRPAGWDALRRTIGRSASPPLIELIHELGVIFGDTQATKELEQIALQPTGDPARRRVALEQLIDARTPGIQTTLEKLLTDPITAGVAARGLLLYDEDPKIPSQVLEHWNILGPEARSSVIGLMASRPATAAVLLDAIAREIIPRASLAAFHARQIRNFNNDLLNRQLAEVWGEVRTSGADKKQLMERYRNLLTPERLKAADVSRGRQVFSQVCAVCHKLYGQGAAIGPDLTGSGRANLDYLLENIVDPNAIVPADYRVSDIELKDDRSLTGLVVSRNERTVTLQTPTEKLTIDRTEIVKMRQTSISLMPEGLLQGMKDDEVRDLIAYLMTPNQVALPTVSAK